jgi:hypothetical protein
MQAPQKFPDGNIKAPDSSKALRALTALEDNWDSLGALKPKKEAVEAVQELKQ